MPWAGPKQKSPAPPGHWAGAKKIEQANYSHYCNLTDWEILRSNLFFDIRYWSYCD